MSNYVLQFCWRKDEYKNTTIICPFEDNSQFVWGHQKLWLVSSTQWYNLLVCLGQYYVDNFYMMILHEGDGICAVWSLQQHTCQGAMYFCFVYETRGCVTHCGLAIYTKTYLKAKEELWKFKYFTMQIYNLQKNPLKETKIFQDIITL